MTTSLICENNETAPWISRKNARLNYAYNYLDSLVQAQKSFYLIYGKFMQELAAEIKHDRSLSNPYLRHLKLTHEYALQYLDSKANQKRKKCAVNFSMFLTHFRSNLLEEIARIENYEIPFYE
jgi:hypothetical protein